MGEVGVTKGAIPEEVASPMVAVRPTIKLPVVTAVGEIYIGDAIWDKIAKRLGLGEWPEAASAPQAGLWDARGGLGKVRH